MAASTITSSRATVDKATPITRCNCTVSAIVLSLDPASSYPLDEYTVKKVDTSANTVTITPSTGETVEGAATYVLSAQGDYVTLSPNGDGWGIVDESVTVNAGIAAINEDISQITNSGQIAGFVVVTQAEYDELPAGKATDGVVYVIVEA